MTTIKVGGLRGERQFVRALGDQTSVSRPKYPANSSFGEG
jgi:hypothetical protein